VPRNPTLVPNCPGSISSAVRATRCRPPSPLSAAPIHVDGTLGELPVLPSLSLCSPCSFWGNHSTAQPVSGDSSLRRWPKPCKHPRPSGPQCAIRIKRLHTLCILDRGHPSWNERLQPGRPSQLCGFAKEPPKKLWINPLSGPCLLAVLQKPPRKIRWLAVQP